MSNWFSFTSYSPFFDGSEVTTDETEFLLAIASYQKRFQRRYPTWREVLHILHCLGYRKVAAAEPITQPLPPNADKPEISTSKFETGIDEPP